jgi:hypothetical protein
MSFRMPVMFLNPTGTMLLRSNENGGGTIASRKTPKNPSNTPWIQLNKSCHLL